MKVLAQDARLGLQSQNVGSEEGLQNQKQGTTEG